VTTLPHSAAHAVVYSPSKTMADFLQGVWVPVIRSKSCGLRILMDQPTESIPSHDPPSRHGDS
jgi:hypothetical protein